MKIVTLWPRFCRPTAASTISRSAPPMPRSGWKKTIRFCALAGCPPIELVGLDIVNSRDAKVWLGQGTDHVDS